MYHKFSEDDLSRLLRLASSVSEERGCEPPEAIGMIERAVDISRNSEAPARRSVIDYADRVRRIRIRRNEMLGLTSLRDPVWDMLLDLLVARDRNDQTSIGSLCQGSGVPPTTALRHLEQLEQQGMIERWPDPEDQRRTLVRLLPEAALRIERLVAELQNCA